MKGEKFYGSRVRKRKTITDNNAKDKVESLNLQTDRKKALIKKITYQQARQP